MRSLAALLALVVLVGFEFTFFNMRRAESSLADIRQDTFEKVWHLRPNRCDVPFWTVTRHCDGIFMINDVPTVTPALYACDDEHCKFECGK